MGSLNIKWKLSLLATLAGIGFLILISYNYSATSTLMEFNDISRKTVQLEADMLMLRRHEKDFIARKNLKYSEKFKQTFTEFTKTLSQIEKQLLSVELTNQHVAELRTLLTTYQRTFSLLIKQQQKVGLHAKDGL